MSVAQVKQAANLPAALAEDKTSNLFVDEHGRLHVVGDVAPVASSSAPSSLPEVTVATGTAETLSASPTAATRAILVQAPLANTVAVYVGGSGMTTSTGVELLPGDSITLATRDAAQVFAITTAADQKLRVLVL